MLVGTVPEPASETLRAERSQAGTEKAPMLALPEPFKVRVGFSASKAAIRDRRIQLHPRVSDANVPDGMVEFAWFGCRPQALRLILGESPGSDHHVEPPQETLPS